MSGEIKDLGPAVFIDMAKYAAERRRQGSPTRRPAVFEAFYSYLLPQFEGIDDDQAARLFKLVGGVVGMSLRQRLRTTLQTVLGVEFADAPFLPSVSDAVVDDVDDLDGEDDGRA